MDMPQILELAANTATALAILFAAIQLRLGKKQAVTEFEDNLAREYRELARGIPAEALLGRSLSEEEVIACLSTFYHYINLSNEQVFLRKMGRITDETWENWCDGIQTNLSLPGFKCAWERIKKDAPSSFEELRRLEDYGFKVDPRLWHRKGRGSIKRVRAHNPAPAADV